MYSIRQPLGVVAGITPFNFPAMVPMWMFANAIACGNTFVLKPSEKDPSASLFLAELLKEAGLPDGVFNVVNGDKVAVDRILEHPDIAAVIFVGSTPIARYIYETGTRHGKRVQALGGAKNHMVVLPDADIDMAADAAVSAAYGSAGERCMAISVVVAVGDVADPLVDAHQGAAAQAARSAPATSPTARWARSSPASTATGWPAYLDGAAEAGRDGRGRRARGPRRRPTASSWARRCRPRAARTWRCYRDEIFGPVLVVVRVDSYDEAVALVNANPYGNGTAIFTRDGGAARRSSSTCRCGHGRRQRARSRCRSPTTASADGRRRSSATPTCTAPRASTSTRARKVVTRRWPDPATSHGRPRLPASAR